MTWRRCAPGADGGDGGAHAMDNWPELSIRISDVTVFCRQGLGTRFMVTKKRCNVDDRWATRNRAGGHDDSGCREIIGSIFRHLLPRRRLTANGLCRVCVVDVDEGRLLQPACVATCQNGTQVSTRSARVDAAADHLEMCIRQSTSAKRTGIPKLLDEYQPTESGATARSGGRRLVPGRQPLLLREQQCVLCWRCVPVCDEDAQYTFALTFSERGFHTQISTAFDVPLPGSSCVF